MAKKYKKIALVLCFLAITGLVAFAFLRPATQSVSGGMPSLSSQTTAPLPPQTLLDDNGYYVRQTFNNCGESALSMDLSFYGVRESQQALADLLRPDNNTTGKGDDKSTPPDEIAAQAGTFGLVAYFRPNGSIDILKRLIAAGFPVMTRTLLNTSEDFAHYRVVKGYDDATNQITEEDGMQGENVTFAYDYFLTLWKPFNYGYIVFAPQDKQTEVESILGNDANSATAWQEAIGTARRSLVANPNDTSAEFDLSVADYYIGDYAGSVQAFEKAQPTLSEHALWYQIEPIESYYEVGNYAKVFSLAQNIFSDNNIAYPELYVVEGESYLKEGNSAAAKQAFETALSYNKNLQSAQNALATFGG